MNGPNHAIVLNIHSVERTIARHDELVLAAQAGSPRAFAELHGIYSRRLYRTIVAITNSPEDAEDALQETFLRAYLAIHAFEGRSTVYSWLTRIAIHSALMILRKRRTRSEILFDPQSDGQGETAHFDFRDSAPNPEQVCEFNQRQIRLLRAIRKLGPLLQEPVQMRITRGSSLKEIGKALNISEGAVKARLHRARRRLTAVCRRP